MMNMTISKVARKANVGVETVRFYERRGLIEQPPKPKSGGFRIYPEEAVARIRFIRQAQELGFSLRAIEELSPFESIRLRIARTFAPTHRLSSTK